MAVILGLDCGGSSARALAVDEHGQEIFLGAGGPANIAATPEPVLRQSLGEATDGCPPVDAVVGCFAGLLTERDRGRATGLMTSLFPAAKSAAQPDYAAALAADGDADAVMICGTGSVLAWWQDGKIVKAGGGGPLLGDAGSAFHLGQSLLRQALFPPFQMSELLRSYLLERFHSSDANEIIAAIYRHASPVAEIASVAPVAVEEWRQNVAGAAERMDAHLGEILRQLQPALRPGVRVRVAGGFWGLSERLLPRLHEIDEEQMGGILKRNEVTISVLAQPPLIGAVNLARRLFNS